MLSKLCIFLALASSAVAFTPTFKYGCNATHCSYIFIIPENVTAYVNEDDLKLEVNTLTNLTDALDIAAGNLNASTLSDFDTTFNDTYSDVQPLVHNISTSTNESSSQFESAFNQSGVLLINAGMAYNLTNCLYVATNDKAQKDCLANYTVPGPFPTTAAPLPTTTSTTIKTLSTSTKVPLGEI